MSRQSLEIEKILAILAQTPSRIRAVTAELTPTQLRTSPKESEWSANDVLAHLRSCSDVWGDCIATLLTQDEPTLRAINPRTWIKKTDYPDQEFRPSLHAFAAQRSNLLAILETLAPEAWYRTATVTGAGSPLERTVLSYAQRLAIHERPHIKQIERIVNAVHRS